MADSGQYIRDRSAHNNYLQVPFAIFTKGLSRPAFQLYVWYKGVAGDTGSCWQSLATIGDGCNMSLPTILKARKELADLKLIKISRRLLPKNQEQVIIDIVDVWEENKDCYDTFQPGKRKERLNNRDNSAYQKDLNHPLKKLNIPIKSLKHPSKATLDKLDKEELDKNTLPTNSRKKRRTPSTFDHRAAAELKKVISSHIKVNKNARMEQWADTFRLLRERDGVAIDEIKNAIKWYKHHIGEEYIPEAYSADAFREKYNNNKIPAAMKRTAEEGPGSNGSVDARDVFNELQIMGCSLNFDQEDVDDAAISLGAAAGTFKMKDMPE